MPSPKPAQVIPLRTDAQHNRSLIVEAAGRVFAEQGLDAPMAEVARRAGVGIATLFRRFPAREDLIAATFAAKMTEYADAIDTALADPDPWNGFCGYVTRVCEMQAEDHGFTRILTMTFPAAESLEAERGRGFRGFIKLVARAKASGKLRKDFSHRDLIMVLMANAGVIGATDDGAPHTWRRLVAYMLQAFSADNTQPLPAPPSSKELSLAMSQAGCAGR